MSVSTKYYLYIVHKFIFKCFYLRMTVCMYNSFNTQIFEHNFITYVWQHLKCFYYLCFTKYIFIEYTSLSLHIFI